MKLLETLYTVSNVKMTISYENFFEEITLLLIIIYILCEGYGEYIAPSKTSGFQGVLFLLTFTNTLLINMESLLSTQSPEVY